MMYNFYIIIFIELRVYICNIICLLLILIVDVIVDSLNLRRFSLGICYIFFLYCYFDYFIVYYYI